MRIRKGLFRIFVMFVALALIAVACGDDSSTADDPAPDPDATAPEPGDPDPEPGDPDPEPEPPPPPDTAKDPAEATRAETLIVDIDSGLGEDPENFNPYSGAQRDAGLSQVLTDPLFLLNILTGELEPWMAESIESNSDATQWTLTLRDGVQWSDGEAVTADDVLFTVEMLQTVPELSAGTKFEGVEATAVNDRTVRFDLTESNQRFALSSFSTALASQAFFVVPEHIWSTVDDIATFKNYDPEGGWPVFSGPYELDSVTDTSFTYLRRNDWWAAEAGLVQLPQPLKVRFVSFGGEEQKLAAMDQGDLDWATNISPGAYLALRQGNEDVAAWSENAPFGQLDLCPRSLEFNHNNPILADANLRWGIAHLINREAVIDVGYGGFGAPPSRHFMAAYPALNRYVDLLDDAGLTDKYPFAITDDSMAAARLGAAGYVKNGDNWEKDGQRLSLKISNYDDPTINNLVKILVEQLTAAGIDASQDTMQIPDFIDGLLKAGFEAYVFFGSCAGSTVDPWQAMDSFSVRHLPDNPEDAVGGFYSNTFRWSSDNAVAYGDIVSEINTLPVADPKIDDLFVEAMELWLEDLPEIPLAQHPIIHPYSSRYWTGFPNENDPYIQAIVAAPTFAEVLMTIRPAG